MRCGVADRHTGTNRLSISRGNSERYGICEGRDSSVRISLPSYLKPGRLSVVQECESMYQSVIAMLSG